MHHPLEALSIALRRDGSIAARRRPAVLAELAAAVDTASLVSLAWGLPPDERDAVRDLLPDTPLPNPEGWEPVARLGRGGMGDAWLCGRRSGGLAVLKTVRADLLGDPQVRARFVREITITRRLRHANIVAALADDAAAGWLLLEFVAGGDLRAAMRVTGALSEADCLAVAAQVAEGLSALEAAGLVHRDLKPANLFVTPEGVVRLADLGLACAESADRTRLTAAGRAVGSWSFMSPEQLVGAADIDRRSDHFSLGATMVALLAGRTPGGEQQGALSIDKAERLVRLSPAMRGLLARLLHPDRALRTADAAELRAAIAEAAAAVGGQGCAPSLALRSTAAHLDRADRSDAEDTMVLPVTVSAGPPLSCDRILIGQARGPARWLVFARQQMVLGKLRGGDVDVPLRNYPVESHRDGLEELSRRHLAVGRDAGRAWICDLGSANGSRLDGVALNRDQRQTLTPGEESILDLAGQVFLGVRAVAGGVVLRRLRNTRQVGYALLGDRLSLGRPGADLPWPEATTDLRLQHRDGIWLVDGEPLREGVLPGLPGAWVRALEVADFDVGDPS
jgi:hypothetical protein